MKVNQISVFLENKSGRLAEVTKTLGNNGINIRALAIADTTDFGILRLIVSDPEKACRILKEEGFTVSETEILAVQVPDKPGGLAGILGVLNNSKINIEYMYAFVGKSGADAVVVFRVEDIDRAIGLLRDSGISLLSGAQVYSL
ncbi:MAG: ACT domain-containing protein [Bacillota bacterium]